MLPRWVRDCRLLVCHDHQNNKTETRNPKTLNPQTLNPKPQTLIPYPTPRMHRNAGPEVLKASEVQRQDRKPELHSPLPTNQCPGFRV